MSNFISTYSRIYLPALFLLLPLLLFTPQAYATHDDLVSQVPRKLIRVGIFPLAPLNYFDEAGLATGLYPDIIRAIQQKEHWQMEFVPCNWSQCLEKLQDGEIDLMTTIAHTPERALVMDFNKEPVADIWGQLFVLPSSKINSIGDLGGKPVGIMHRDINGSNFLETARNLGVSCEIIEFATHDEIFEAILQQQIVAGIAPQHFGHTKAKQYGVVGSSIVFSPFSVYFAVKKDANYDILAHIDEHLAGWKQDSNSIYYQAINHWMGGKEYEQVIPRWVLWLGGSVFLLTMLLFTANRTLKLQIRLRTKDLQATEKKYRQLIEIVNSIILICNSEGKILFLNRYGLEIFGFSENEIIGQHVVGTIVPETDNNDCDLGMMVKNIYRDPEKFALTENENICKNGRRLLIQWTNQAIIGTKGSLKETLSVGIDVTERKSLEADLRQAQKFEAIATLAGGIAHDFNNILAAILGYAELAKFGAQHGQEISEEIQEVITASYRAKELVQQILTFSRKTPKMQLPIIPTLIVKESLKLLKATLPTSLELHEEITTTKFKILADPVEIQQVVVNLCTNALHAMANGHGKLLVKLMARELGRDELADEENILPGWFIELTVSDTGSGMSRQIRERIFEPYFTTKKTGEGTGMGLAMVHGIVKECGGFIRLESEENYGTTFRIYFPVVQTENSQSFHELATVETEILPYGNERILVVDDEKTIVSLLSSFLEGLGYEVTALIDSEKALEEFGKDPDGYDLLITDQTMPGLTGAELASEILKIKPNLPIILCTGHSTAITQEQIIEIGVKEFMLKPIGINKLANTVRKVLDN